MGIIIGIFVRTLTFPGLVVDAFVLKILCQLFEIPVYKVNYFDVLAKNDGVEFEIPQNYLKILGITILPFILMTLLASSIFGIFVNLPGNPLNILLMWLGISIAIHSFPTTKLGKILWNSSIKEIKENNFFAILGFPIVVLIYIIRILHIFWLDVIYSIVLLLIIYKYYRK